PGSRRCADLCVGRARLHATRRPGSDRCQAERSERSGDIGQEQHRCGHDRRHDKARRRQSTDRCGRFIGIDRGASRAGRRGIVSIRPHQRIHHLHWYEAVLDNDRRALAADPRPVPRGRRYGLRTGLTPTDCSRCGTELPPDALACPACGSLIHADTLKQLAAAAGVAARAGDLVSARNHWTAALRLLPAHSQQHAAIRDRLAELNRRIDAASPGGTPAAADQAPWWRRGAPGLVAVALVLISKLKFLLLGLTKASTFISMFAFFGVYWSIYGWPLALGLVLSIYIHEMGHVAMLRRLGIDAGAPMFIPGVGAFVMLKQHIGDPLNEAKVGLAGPVWGLGAALAAFGIYAVTGARIWLAIAQLTGFLNLFNLIPVWQLDG